MSDKINVALIYGSTREGRFCDTVAGWAEREIAGRSELALDVLDPEALSLPVRHEREDTAVLVALAKRIAHAQTLSLSLRPNTTTPTPQR